MCVHHFSILPLASSNKNPLGLITVDEEFIWDALPLMKLTAEYAKIETSKSEGGLVQTSGPAIVSLLIFVPQGSILGQLLFLIYINYLSLYPKQT